MYKQKSKISRFRSVVIVGHDPGAKIQFPLVIDSNTIAIFDLWFLIRLKAF